MEVYLNRHRSVMFTYMPRVAPLTDSYQNENKVSVVITPTLPTPSKTGKQAYSIEDEMKKLYNRFVNYFDVVIFPRTCTR